MYTSLMAVMASDGKASLGVQTVVFGHCLCRYVQNYIVAAIFLTDEIPIYCKDLPSWIPQKRGEHQAAY